MSLSLFQVMEKESGENGVRNRICSLQVEFLDKDTTTVMQNESQDFVVNDEGFSTRFL